MKKNEDKSLKVTEPIRGIIDGKNGVSIRPECVPMKGDILRDTSKNVDLAKMEEHKFCMKDDGKVSYSFKVTSIRAHAKSARLVYIFKDVNEKELTRWDAGPFICECGDENVPKRGEGQIASSIVPNVAYVDSPVPGDWDFCRG